MIEQQMRLCEIPAPPFGESARAAAFKQAFEGLGLTNVRIDSAGNVLGERPGLAARPHLVLSAHLDTVFPADTRVTPARSGSVLTGPGIADDCRGLAVLLGVVRALTTAKVQTAGSITFVGTVGEEGLGDLRGVKHLFESGAKGQVDRFVSIDGAGLGITGTAVGSLRYRVTFNGPGGHSYGDFGVAEPCARARSRRRRHRRSPGAARASDDVQRGAGRRWDVREFDCLVRMDGSRPAVRGSCRAPGARCRLSESGRCRPC